MSVVGERLQPTLFERSHPGRGGGKIPHPPPDALDRVPAAARRATPPALPELNEPEVVRHYVNLSQLNYAVDTGFYPLGSCTMKFNPKLNEWAARLPGFAGLHPMAPDAVAQGTLQLLFELEAILAEISGMAAVTLQPAAGAHGELTGILMIRAYHRSRGDHERTEVLVPDSSHGTNPATATMAGFRTITIPSAADGGVDVDAFRAALGPADGGDHDHQPVDPRAVRAADRRPARGDPRGGRAGLHGRREPERDPRPVQAGRGRLRRDALQHPQDVQHAARRRRSRRGPGRRPAPTWSRSCPRPASCARDDGAYRLEAEGERPTSIGRMRSFVASSGVLVRAYAYLRAHGSDGLREVSDDAVLAANYLKARVGEAYRIPFDRPCKHEFVASASDLKQPHRRAHPRRGEAIDRQGLPSADHLLPADGRGGHAHRAHGDRVARDARRLRRRADRDRPRGGRRIPGS